ncbi:hypothetical protein RSAG8_06760, partial [Rhizoctonia solani AG-8 WAC10335]
MAAREQDDAIGDSLLAQTNPDSLERPCYLPWLHFLAMRSNLIPDRHLWTASEFSIPHYKLEDTTSDAILPEFCNEEDTGPLDLTFDLNRAAEPPSSGDFAAHNPFYAPTESPARSARERQAMRQPPQAPEAREQSPDPHPSLSLPPSAKNPGCRI